MMIFFKKTWKTRYIFWRCRLADYFIRFVVCNIKSVQEHKIVFLQVNLKNFNGTYFS